MKLPLIAGHRFLAHDGQLYLQPNRVYRYKIVVCMVLALAAFTVAWAKIVSYDMRVLLQVTGVIVLGYALFDRLFRVNLTYVFDGQRQQVYRKFPGLFTQKLMSFDEVCILPETEHGALRYALSRKRNKYGKSYPISDFFSDSTKGVGKQERFEEEVLTVMAAFIKGKALPESKPFL